VIDFGDSVHTLLVNDLAIAMAYSMVSSFGKKKPLEAAAAVYAGYRSVASLQPNEVQVICTLTACRLAISFTIGMFSYSEDPANEYLLFHAEPAWNALQALRSRSNTELLALFEAAAGDTGSYSTAPTTHATTEERVIANLLVQLDHLRA
jgi:Ser/Thr protein kinase RdoA (MazF antagonist)